jgi:hypothetical protein
MKVLFRPRAECKVLSLVRWMRETPGRIAFDANGKFVKNPGCCCVFPKTRSLAHLFDRRRFIAKCPGG